MNYAPAIITIEGIPPFYGEAATDRRWNGWAVVRFKEDGAAIVAKALRDNLELVEYVPGVRIVRNLSDDDEPTATDTPDEKGFWHIGSFEWIWESYPVPTDLERFNGSAWESVPDGSLPAPVALEIAEAIGGGMAISDEFITRDGTVFRW